MQNRVGQADFLFLIFLFLFCNIHFPVLHQYVTMQANKSQNEKTTQLQLWKEPL